MEGSEKIASSLDLRVGYKPQAPTCQFVQIAQLNYSAPQWTAEFRTPGLSDLGVADLRSV
jgi:hypothetical protein